MKPYKLVAIDPKYGIIMYHGEFNTKLGLLLNWVILGSFKYRDCTFKFKRRW